jgi:hypothetical protein
MRIDVQFDTAAVTRQLTRLQREQIPFATALTLTRLADAAKKAMPAELERILDRPKPYTTRYSVYTERATKTKLYSVVGFKDRQAAYLEALLTGGRRKLKGSEQRFLGRPIVPGPDVRLDRYGNVPGPTLIRILKAAQAKAVMPDGRFVFVTDAGVFARKARSRQVQTLLLFADSQPVYRKEIDLEKIVGKVVRRHAQAEFNKALTQALRTSR